MGNCQYCRKKVQKKKTWTDRYGNNRYKWLTRKLGATWACQKCYDRITNWERDLPKQWEREQEQKYEARVCP